MYFGAEHPFLASQSIRIDLMSVKNKMVLMNIDLALTNLLISTDMPSSLHFGKNNK